MENSIHIGKLVGGLLLGAAIGGTLGLLYAPDKGNKTRKKLLSKGEDLTDGLKEKFNAFLDNTKKEVETVKVKTNGAIEKAKVKT